jgi:hypothetical protein
VFYRYDADQIVIQAHLSSKERKYLRQMTPGFTFKSRITHTFVALVYNAFKEKIFVQEKTLFDR